MSKKVGGFVSGLWLGVLALLAVPSCERPEDPGQLTLYVDRITFPGVVSLKLHVDRIDVVMSETPEGPEQITTLTDEDRVIETIGAPGIPPSEVYSGFVEPGYLKQLRVVVVRAEALFTSGEVCDVKLPSQAQTGEKLVPHEEVRILDGLTTDVTMRLDSKQTIITPPAQGLLIRPVLTMLLGEVGIPPVNEYTPGVLLLWFKEGTTEEQINAAVEEVGGKVVWSDLETLWYVIGLPEGTSEADARDAFLATGLVDTYTLDWEGFALYEPSDDGYYTDCFLDRIEATGAGLSALDWCQGDPDVIVAVIDGGLALEDIGPPYVPFNDFVSSSTGLSKLWLNPGEDVDGDGILTMADFNDVDDDGNGIVDDLNGVCYITSLSFTHATLEPLNEFYVGPKTDHGTGVASIVGAEGDNDSAPGSPSNLGEEAVGVCPNVTIMPVNVFGDREKVSFKAYFAGMLYARRHGAHITDSSIGFPVQREGWDILGWDFDFTIGK